MDMLHAVYCVAWLAGDQPIRSVSAALAWRRGDAVEDLALCRFGFDGGFGQVNLAWGQGPGGIEIMGSEGRLVLFYRSFGTGPFEPPDQLHVFRGSERIPVAFDPDKRPPFTMQPVWRDFLDSIQEGREPVATGENGCTTLEAVIAAYASAARGRTMMLPLETNDPVYYRGVAALLGDEHAAEEVIALSH
jgi:predicted dehydrogenase